MPPGKRLPASACQAVLRQTQSDHSCGEDGKTYGLRSKAVNLSQHLGHKVTVTGMFRAESAEKEKGEAEEHEKKEASEAGDIRVTGLKMVSDKCQ